MSSYIGIDLGGTSIKGGLIENGRLQKKEVFPVNQQATRETIFEDICVLIKKLATPEVQGIGFAAPAVIDFAKGIIYGLANIPQFNGFAIQDALEVKFPFPVKLQNDANCFVLGEKHFGEAKGYQNVVGLITGTGTGAGLIIDGKLHNGENYGAGELGMIPYLDGCYEDYCSGQFFTTRYNKSGEELALMAAANDPSAIEAFAEYGRHLGSLINLICYFLDPQMVVIGGSVSNSFSLYSESLNAAVKNFYFDHTHKMKVLPSTTNDVAIYGAVGLFYDPANNSKL